VAKRSPILGYNHNVKYRGLVFHVQTEDSGVLSPHLFTHLFHGGVIVSTRKLVYDAGANEEAIKALMQAQHKAVLKELRKGIFDDKIDQYLGGTEGLEPRGGTVTEPIERPSPPELAPPPDSAPIEIIVDSSSDVSKPRTQTAERVSAHATNSEIAAAVTAANASAPTVPPPPRIPAPAGRVPLGARAPTPPPIPTRTPPMGSPTARAAQLDSGPEIEILDEPSARTRAARDTAVEAPLDVGVTEPNPPPRPRASDSQQPPARRTQTGDRASASHNASALPPMTRPQARPAITPPTVVSRPLAQSDGRPRAAADGRESDVIEVYAPAPPSAELPGAQDDRSERPGQYSMNRAKKPSGGEVPLRDKPGRSSAIPSGLAPPRAGDRSGPVRMPTPGGRPTPPVGSNAASANRATPAPVRGQPHTTAPITNRPSTGPSSVVMARPAVIVGAPAKSAAPPPRVRKAREEEGRGFGQGLISEKSLDEVILAYLSEDAEDT